jgi:hypothetical protein
MFERIKKTIAELSKNPAESDTVKALRRQFADLLAKRCKHGEYTDEPFTGCKTCGNPKTVICSRPKVVGKRRNSKGCVAYNEVTGKGCPHFQRVKINDNKPIGV